MTLESNKFWSLLLVLIIATVLRTYQISNPYDGLLVEEGLNGNIAENIFKAYPLEPEMGRLALLPQAVSLSLFPINEPWVIRLPGTILAVLGISFLYLLVKELFSKRIALATSFVVAISSWHIIYSRLALPHIFISSIVLFIALVSLLSFRKKADPKLNYLLFLFVFAFCLFLLAIHAPSAVFGFLIFWVAKYFSKNQFSRKDWGLFFVSSSLMLLALWYLKSFSLPDFYLENWGKNIVLLFKYLFWGGMPLSFMAIGGRSLLFWPIGIAFALGLMRSISFLFERNSSFLKAHFENSESFENAEALRDTKASIKTILWWFCSGFVLFSIGNTEQALKDFVIIFPFLAIFAGIGFAYVYFYLRTHLKESFLLPTGAVLIAILLAYQSAQVYFGIWQKDPQRDYFFEADQVMVAKKIKEISRVYPKYILYQEDDMKDIQPFVFLTDSSLEFRQEYWNIRYIPYSEKDSVPMPSFRVSF